jgi:hypothetical protein
MGAGKRRGGEEHERKGRDYSVLKNAERGRRESVREKARRVWRVGGQQSQFFQRALMYHQITRSFCSRFFMKYSISMPVQHSHHTKARKYTQNLQHHCSLTHHSGHSLIAHRHPSRSSFLCLRVAQDVTRPRQALPTKFHNLSLAALALFPPLLHPPSFAPPCPSSHLFTKIPLLNLPPSSPVFPLSSCPS